MQLRCRLCWGGQWCSVGFIKELFVICWFWLFIQRDLKGCSLFFLVPIFHLQMEHTYLNSYPGLNIIITNLIDLHKCDVEILKRLVLCVSRSNHFPQTSLCKLLLVNIKYIKWLKGLEHELDNNIISIVLVKSLATQQWHDCYLCWMLQHAKIYSLKTPFLPFSLNTKGCTFFSHYLFVVSVCMNI